MKNLLFMLSMFIFMVACDKDDENGNAPLPPDKGGDVEILSKKIVKIVTIEGDYKEGDYSNIDTSFYSYNAEGKITSIERRRRYSSYTDKYQYPSNRIVAKGTSSTRTFDLKDGKALSLQSTLIENGTEWKEYTALAYNTAGYLETVKSKWYEGEVLDSEETEIFTSTNDYITKYNYKVDNNYYGEYIFDYGDFKRLNNANIDLWGLIGYYSLFDSSIGEAFTLGVAGSRCKYLPIKFQASETGNDGKPSTETYEENFEYVVDQAGYITQITVADNKGTDWIFKIYYE